MKQKILFIITKSNWGGAQRYVFDLAASLPKDQFEITVACGGTGARGASPGALIERLSQTHVRTLFVRSFSRDIHAGADLLAFIELWRLFRRERPHVVHLNSSKAGGIGALAARLSGVPRIVFTSHGLAWDEDRGILSRSLIHAATCATFLLCHAVIVLSQDNYERARRCILCAHKIHRIYNGVGPIQLETRDQARALIAAHLSSPLALDECLIGTVAELTKNKGLAYLIRAAGILKRRDVRFQVCIIGRGEERARLEQLIDEEHLSDRVHLIGFVPDAYRYLSAFDIFTLTSIKEGLPYVLLEAGAASLSVAGSLIPGITDILGDAGITIPPKNAAALAQTLERLIASPTDRAIYGQALHHKVERDFSLKHMIEQTLSLYQS